MEPNRHTERSPHAEKNEARLDGQARLDSEARLDQMFRAYREACPEPEASVNFMPGMWAKIEARQVSTNLFGRMAKALVTVALAATVVLGILVSSASQSNSIGTYNGTYLEALTADQVSSLEPLNLERISELEQQ
jgi:hypothetical protein